MSANARVFTLAGRAGLVVRLSDYGGIIMSVLAPDRHGRLANVVLGHDTIEAYGDNPAYLGAIVGRVANRIAGARFTLDGETYQLAANDGAHCLHGGPRGFDRVVWKSEEFSGGVRLSHLSPDGDQGFPGTLDVSVTYSVTDANQLVVDYHATTDRATPVNLTQHSYFNLAGAGDILGHLLEVAADTITPVDDTLIPTGEIMPVGGTAFDFRVARPIGAEYDHNFMIRREGPGLVKAARLEEPRSGRTLDVYTTEPGIQVYTGNFLQKPHTGVTLETQGFPDAPNQPQFPSVVLKPDEEYRSRTMFRFGVETGRP